MCHQYCIEYREATFKTSWLRKHITKLCTLVIYIYSTAVYQCIVEVFSFSQDVCFSKFCPCDSLKYNYYF